MASILLIEDDDAQRLIAAFALKKAGHEVREAADGPEGIAAARAQRPDLVVCDVRMPGMTGYEVVADLRADAELVHVPVILLTALAERSAMRQGMTAGADDYLTKPYRPQELCEAIDALLARKMAQQQAFMNSMSDVMESALEQQKEELGRQYESQLVRELNGRWSRATAAGDVKYRHAFLLLADLLGPQPPADAAELADLVKRVQTAARDTLYLFGAGHILPYGSKLLLAIFDGDEATMTAPPQLRVLRAAHGLVSAAPRNRPATVAIHTGPVTLVAVHDPIHGDQGHTLVPGDSIAATASVLDAAAANGWRVAGSEAMVELVRDAAEARARATTTRGELALELVPIKG